MPKIKAKRKIVKYTLELNQHEMETLFVALGLTSTDAVYSDMEDYGFHYNRDDDTPYSLYEAVRIALDQ